MTTPLATPAELGLYVDDPIVNTDPRALLLIQSAHDLLETYVNPLPASAKVLEITVAARAWTNPTSARQAGIGSAQMSFGAENSHSGIGGLYVSKQEERTLRRLAGRTGAFSVDLLSAPTPPTVVPVVSNIDPDVAPTGDLVRVEGYGFQGTTAVTFAGTSAEFVEVSDTLLHVVVPAGVAGVVGVVVTNAIGASSAYSYERG